MSRQRLSRIQEALRRFIFWLDSYGETSQDHQDFYANGIGRNAKAAYYRYPTLGKLAVMPMVICEACLPAARRLFSPPIRLPIADAHYAMGFTYLFRLTQNQEYYDRAVHYLEVLRDTRCPGYKNFGWGYPFHWQTRGGLIRSGTPLITTTPYCYEAFEALFRSGGSHECRETMRSIAEHVLCDYLDYDAGPDASTCTYTPLGGSGVINASAYRSFMLLSAWKEFQENAYLSVAEKNLNFVLQSQKTDGSWFYAIDARDFIDHFHTCFILKALAKIDGLIDHPKCRKAIEKGVDYYIHHLFDQDGLPKPFARAPRLTVYRNELYDYAECINLCLLLKEKYGDMEKIYEIVLSDLLGRWQNRNGSFKSRKLHVGWDKVPMHRWAQSQIFRSLCLAQHIEMRQEIQTVVGNTNSLI